MRVQLDVPVQVRLRVTDETPHTNVRDVIAVVSEPRDRDPETTGSFLRGEQGQGALVARPGSGPGRAPGIENIRDVDSCEVRQRHEFLDAEAPLAGDRSAERAVRQADGRRRLLLAEPLGVKYASKSPAYWRSTPPLGEPVIRS
ncbi:hypothetical protein ACFWE5_00875 [Cellulosimicrobium funkei]|uniref:hypothetical protein n=1 Tax=Cellulosimicrobium funkei TaxID=264251 RepID=UPI00364D7CA4